MTKDQKLECPSEEVPNGITAPQQERSFHIVLIDIKKAANDHSIHCVEKPLAGDEDLKFVALSYRSGEVQETAVDTRLGYTANVTSFNLDDFYDLCKMMTREMDLRAMDYVWVDAICIDHTNPMHRKATLFQINAIYERANYIVAIPDLHLTYLKNINMTNVEIINNGKEHRHYIYHLLHGNMATLEQLDQQWLDAIQTPQDPHLRYLLTKYTDFFAIGFMKCKHHHWAYDAKHALDHIFATNPKSRTAPLRNLHLISIVNKVMGNMDDVALKMAKTEAEDAITLTTVDLDKRKLGELHLCDKKHNPVECPLEFFDDTKWAEDLIEEQHGDHEWKQAIPERGEHIRQSMRFLVDLIQDWATRAWVLSECHFAKQKNNKMKFWFIQFGLLTTGNSNSSSHHQEDHDHCSFYDYDFATTANGDRLEEGISSASHGGGGGGSEFCSGFFEEECHFQYSNAVYQVFHVAMQRQLQQQPFLEMVLKSKTSRHDNRLYSILPISEYKDKLVRIMDQGHMHTLVSVKLQLYEWMNIKHKWQLLMLSSHATNIGRLLPTFATSNIMWHAHFPNLEQIDPSKCSFDIESKTAIVLTRQGDVSVLHVKPRFYFHHAFFAHEFEIKPIMRTLSQFDDDGDLPKDGPLNFICLPLECNVLESTILRPVFDSLHHIFLVGCFAKNKWILCPHLFKYIQDAFGTWKFYNDGTTFDIY